MKFKFTLAVFFLAVCPSFISAQILDTLQAPSMGIKSKFVNTRKMQIRNTHQPVLIDPKDIAARKKWGIALTSRGIDHGSDIPRDRVDSLKRMGMMPHLNDTRLMPGMVDDGMLVKGASMVTPQINRSFKGNKYDYWSPTDNSIAVADDGYIISVVNASLFFSDVNGNLLQEEKFSDFLAFLNLTGNYFDPKVIYDPVEDKFIMVVLNGNTHANSTVVICFSTSSDPTGTWWVYTYPGDPTGRGLWFDFPSIGISTDDLYISGNLFTENNIHADVFIYQLLKGPGFAGQNLTGINWWDVRDAYGFTDFTVAPVSYGFDGTTGPGMFFISTDPGGGTEAMVHYIDNNSLHNPTLSVFNADIPNYFMPLNGLMAGTQDRIKTNDCKVLSGFYADDHIHFAFNTQGDDGYTKVYYCRLNTNDLTQTTLHIGQQPFECAFPSVAPFGSAVTDRSVLIGYQRTGESIFPEFRVIAFDHDLNSDGSVLIKEGEGFVNVSNDNLERWGDYSGIARRHIDNDVEVWVAGSYGEDSDNGSANVLSTWIAQVTNEQTAGAPVANFAADQTLVMAGQIISFTDHSSNAPTGWAWTFEGGTPANSNLKNPEVTYNIPGTYSVSLVASNPAGQDTETKTAYITVTAIAEAPIAGFTSDVTDITAGDVVSFQDISVNEPTQWQWYFPGGTPNASDQQNPLVAYPNDGCFDVTLIASNAAGENSVTKTCYINVLMTDVREPDSIFNRFIVFPNPVTTGRVNIEFALEQATELNFFIADERGIILKNVLYSRVKAGIHNLAFNTDLLVPGVYYLVIYNRQNNLLRSERLIVSQ